MARSIVRGFYTTASKKKDIVYATLENATCVDYLLDNEWLLKYGFDGGGGAERDSTLNQKKTSLPTLGGR